ncbi:serine protease HtrA [Tepidimicrobium xylanilyticum]|uniref:serine protease HtrA n=1 Tax=Tepidimicrobium xylanilyticum TaxID=1123352 RepID=UPI0026507E62|nr:trypsin-like peptidase domain-containing protein [Tepidimicrobium xylanilyticum]GMG97396.1 protease [Tepidimicrobium xylanilyticum]
MDDEKRDLDQMMEIIEGIDTEVENHEENQYKEEENISITVDNNKEKRKEKRKRILSYVAIALISSIIGGLISPYIVINYLYADMLPSLEEQANSYNDNIIYNIEGGSINAISLAAKKAMSSVVGITTKEVQNFGFFSQEVDGVGSGVIVDKNGYILTNSHVVGDGNAKEIMVLLENGDKVQGTVLWNDNLTDLAIVKIDATNLPVATLGDSDKLEVGEIAIAIGNPLGMEFQRTVTSGIISGLHRSIQVDQYNVIEDLIQTDASINEGNSGGPLLNSKGEVIGINTAKIKTAEGLGFAIPINTVKPIIEQVVKEGTYKTVFVGITGVEVELYERRLGIELTADEGVIILEVVPNSPADKANLRAGDIITKIDDQEIKNMNQLKRSLYKYKKGDKAKLSITRNGKEEQVEIEFSILK